MVTRKQGIKRVCKICETIRFGDIVGKISDDFVAFYHKGRLAFSPLVHTHNFPSCSNIDRFRESYVTYKKNKPEFLEMDLIDGHLIIQECIRSV